MWSAKLPSDWSQNHNGITRHQPTKSLAPLLRIWVVRGSTLGQEIGHHDFLWSSSVPIN